jgi:hypothetical protein
MGSKIKAAICSPYSLKTFSRAETSLKEIIFKSFPSDCGTPAESGTLCYTNDATIVVTDQPGQYWKKKENVIETN